MFKMRWKRWNANTSTLRLIRKKRKKQKIYLKKRSKKEINQNYVFEKMTIEKHKKISKTLFSIICNYNFFNNNDCNLQNLQCIDFWYFVRNFIVSSSRLCLKNIKKRKLLWKLWFVKSFNALNNEIYKS